MTISLLYWARRAVTADERLAMSAGYCPGGGHRFVAAGLSLAMVGLVGAGLVTALIIPGVMPFSAPPLTTWNEPIRVEPPPVPQQMDPKPSPGPTTVVTPLAPLSESVVVMPPDPPVSVPTPLVTPPVVQDPPPSAHVPVLRAPRRDARYSAHIQPPYPAARQREQVEGSCRVRVAVASTGRVTAVEAVACPDDAFFRATERQALRSWRFLPATRDGTAVAGEIEQNVVFRISNE